MPEVSETGRGSNEKLDVSCEHYLRLQVVWLVEAIQPTVWDSTTPVCIDLYSSNVVIPIYCKAISGPKYNEADASSG